MIYSKTRLYLIDYLRTSKVQNMILAETFYDARPSIYPKSLCVHNNLKDTIISNFNEWVVDLRMSDHDFVHFISNDNKPKHRQWSNSELSSLENMAYLLEEDIKLFMSLSTRGYADKVKHIKVDVSPEASELHKPKLLIRFTGTCPWDGYGERKICESFISEPRITVSKEICDKVRQVVNEYMYYPIGVDLHAHGHGDK